MDWLYSLFMGEGIAHTVLVLSLVITVGIMLGKIKICGISFGVTRNSDSSCSSSPSVCR